MPKQQFHSGPPGRGALRQYAFGALLLLLCAAVAWQLFHAPQEREAAAASFAGFAVTRASDTTDARLILDCTMPAMQDEHTLRRMAASLYASHRDSGFEQVLIRYRLAADKDARSIKAIAVLSKNGSTFGFARQ